MVVRSDIEKAAVPDAGVADDWPVLDPVDVDVDAVELVDEPDGAVAVVEAELIARVSVAELYWELLSTTLTVKVELVALVGVPEMVPLLLMVRPGGRLPEKSDHVYVPEPPEADSVAE